QPLLWLRANRTGRGGHERRRLALQRLRRQAGPAIHPDAWQLLPGADVPQAGLHQNRARDDHVLRENILSLMPQKILMGLWAAWVVSWWVSAFWSDRPAKRLKRSSELLYRALTILAVLLLFGTFESRADPVWLHSLRHPAAAWTLVGLTAAGLAFTW